MGELFKGGEKYGAMTAYSTPNSSSHPYIINFIFENGVVTSHRYVTTDPQQAWYAEIDIENSDSLPFAPTFEAFDSKLTST